MSRKGKRIYILCEGDTEENAIKYFIRPQWDKMGELKSVALDSKTIKPKDIHKQTKQLIENGDCDAVFLLFDLYGFPQELKGLDYKEKQEYIVQKLKTESNYHDLFFPHLAVHEIEAWVLADGDTLTAYFRNKISGENNAEEKNFQNNPSKRLNDLFNKYKHTRYYKNSDSSALFRKLNFTSVYNNCPYFRLFYDELVKIGQEIKNKG